MASNSSKLWLQDSLNRLAIARAQGEIQRQGMALPCHVVAVSGAIVTVQFDVAGVSLPQVTIPKAESPYFRQPTQIGDKGSTVSCDVYLGGISGLGGGVADMTRRGNLSALWFQPISNSGSPPANQTQAIVQGPGGALIQTVDGTSTVDVTETGTTITLGSTTFVLTSTSITMTAGGKTVVVDSSGLTIDGIPFGTHAH
ncbi:MAG: hypothetical protein ACYCRF_09835, partial [Acidithiobacillus sp.]